MYNDNIPFLGREERPRPTETPEEEQEFPTEIVSNGVPKIRVVGVGGAGNNAINRMIDAGIQSAEFIAVNTDAQVLLCNKAPVKVQIGVKRTNGLGAGSNPEIGREAAEESREAILRAIRGTDLLFITAGMGGGTGTGAAPVIAKLAREEHILTVAIVTEPFTFEGKRRTDIAVRGINTLRKYVDTLVIIPNQKILSIMPKQMSFAESFAIADDVLKQGIRGLADLIVTPGIINVDFADVSTVLRDKGLAHFGVGVAKGDDRIVKAVRLAVQNPLVDTTVEGATGMIVNIVGGPDFTMEEYSRACDLLHGLVDYNCLVIAGACIHPDIRDEVEVTVIATGFPSAEIIFSDIEQKAQQLQRAAAVGAPQPASPQTYVPAQPQPAAPASPASPVRPQQPAEPVPPVSAPAPAARPEKEEPKPEATEEKEDPKQGELPAFVRRLMGRKN